MKPMFPLFLAALFVAGPAFPQAAPTTTIDRIAAVVDEDVILRSELDRAVANVRAQYAGQPGPAAAARRAGTAGARAPDLMRLQVARAADTGIRISDDELQQAMQPRRPAEQA